MVEHLRDLSSLVGATLFRQLLRTGEPIATTQLAPLVGIELERLAPVLDELAACGGIRRDNGGQIVGSSGLSVVPDRHKIEMGGRLFWTWCAYDFLGIFGALEASGRAISTSPTSGAQLEIIFRDGRPQSSEYVLFRPDRSCLAPSANVYEEWCPNSNLFEDEASARRWAAGHGLPGDVLGLEEATSLAAAAWRPLCRALSPGRRRSTAASRSRGGSGRG